MTNGAPNITQIRDNGYGGSRNGSPFNGFVIHYAAGHGRSRLRCELKQLKFSPDLPHRHIREVTVDEFTTVTTL